MDKMMDYMELMDTHKYIGEIVKDVKCGICGRIADEDHNTEKVMMAALLSGDGDHLEIGTLHGGSAICVALAKKHAGLYGQVYCVDPLDGYYRGTIWECATDCLTHVPVSIETVIHNASVFGVLDKITVIQAKSHPWPKELDGMKFASAYIDGDHWGDGPFYDWYNVSKRVHGYVVFDNYDVAHPDVKRVCDLAGSSVDWEFVHSSGISYVVKRRQQV